MKSILVLTNCVAGLHSFRREVMKAIVDEGYTLYLSFPDKDERAKYFESIGCKLLDISFNRRGMNPIKDIKLLFDYVRIMKKIKPEAVLTYTIKPNIYGGMAASLCGVPQIANVTGLGDSLENPGTLQKLTIFLYKFGLRNAKTVFFQNSANRRFCIDRRIVNENKSKLLPGSGVNINYHIYQEYPREGVQKFLFIARLLKDKGTDEYFEAAKVLKSKYPKTEFQILGSIEGDYRNKVDSLSKEGIIKFLGSTSDVRPFIGKSNCTVLPSYHEGLSNVNLESAANGRPVITTNVPGCRETVDDGITGYLCEARSAESLIEAIEKFINLSHEVKANMGKEGRNKVEREYDRNIVVKAYMDELKRL